MYTRPCFLRAFAEYLISPSAGFDTHPRASGPTTRPEYSRKRMFDDPWTCVYSYEHPDVEIDGQADDGLDISTIPSCRGGDHREDQS